MPIKSLDVDSPYLACTTNMGCFGDGRSDFLVSIDNSSSVLGLSTGWCWTHSRPIWTHRPTSDGWHELATSRSKKSTPLVSHHDSHACCLVSDQPNMHISKCKKSFETSISLAYICKKAFALVVITQPWDLISADGFCWGQK